MTGGEINHVMEDIPGHCDVLTFVQVTLRATGGLWTTSNRTKGGMSSVSLAPFTWNNEGKEWQNDSSAVPPSQAVKTETRV